nr:MAG TPA: hypothetical protein [Caudoviricetes sp.]
MKCNKPLCRACQILYYYAKYNTGVVSALLHQMYEMK